ncbi:MAG: ATP-binding protein [Caulobacter sp.]
MADQPPVQDNQARLREVRALDVEALRPTIDRVCRLARHLSGAAHAYVVLVDEDRVWQSGFEGVAEGYGPAEASTSARTIGAAEPVWGEDVRRDWPDHEWVAAGPRIRFYANAPLVLSDGVVIGALCLADPVPRARDDALLARIVDFAELLSEAIERQRAERRRKDADRETRAAVALKEAIMRSAPVALAMVDRDMRYVYVNQRWSHDTGVPVEQAIGAHVGELFPESFAQLRHVYERCLEGEKAWSDKVHVPTPARPDRWLRAEVGPWHDADGQVAGLIAMSHDITDVISSLQQSERSEQRLKLALEIADVLVYEVDYEARELRVDGAEDTFFGGEVTYDMISRDAWAVVHPDDKPVAIEAWNRHLAEGAPFRTEYRMVSPDGREVWAFSGAELTMRDDGRPARLLGVLKNITDRKRSEAQVAHARDVAEAASRAKSEFLANMSHEIRTPLNGVMGVASALARTGLSEAQTEMVDLIRTSGQTLEVILSDLLDLARIESGRLDLAREPFHLATSLRAAAEIFRPQALEKGLAFAVEVDPATEAWFEGDAARLRQIVGNLLSNAVKFTAGGRVALTARSDGQRLIVAVSDTGIGFDETVLARLFERFEQADGSITRRFGGTGLGLAISRQLAAALGGSLEASSHPGVGSTFTLTVPLEACEAPGADGRQAPAGGGEGRAPRVLLAEDHPTNRRVVALLLEPLGVELTMVENGAEAVEAAGAGRYDLILMDMQMPVMDGLTAIRRIRGLETERGLARTPIWGLSANALAEHAEASRQAGADGHLTKPISAEALFAVLETACAGGDEDQAAA